MKVEIHKLFSYLLECADAEPEAILGLSVASPMRLGQFLNELDPDLPLDWNNRSFLGLPELRRHVVHGCGLDGICTPDDVLITAGAAEANFLAISQQLQAGDELITESPGWPQARVLGEAKSCKVVEIRRIEAEGWAFPIDALGAAVNDRTRIIFLSNPSNPTGRVFSGDELAEIVEIARRVGAWLIVDEVYAGMEWQGERAPSVAGLYERGITTGSVSKVLGLQGLRTGWLVCRDPELVRDAYVLRENTSEIMNILGEVISEIAMRPGHFEQVLENTRAEAVRNLTLLERFIQTEPRLSWHAPQAGLVGLARLHGDIDGEAFARRLLAEPYRTFLIPGSAYDQPNHVRLGVGGGPDVNLETGLERMRALLASL